MSASALNEIVMRLFVERNMALQQRKLNNIESSKVPSMEIDFYGSTTEQQTIVIFKCRRPRGFLLSPPSSAASSSLSSSFV
jgi:hypothetical protein